MRFRTIYSITTLYGTKIAKLLLTTNFPRLTKLTLRTKLIIYLFDYTKCFYLELL